MFETCPQCGFEWKSRDCLLGDPRVELVGYQAHFEELESGLFLFNHDCRTTLGIEAGEFVDLYDGPVFAGRKTGGPQCRQYCLHENDLRPCPEQCECAFVREILQRVRSWKKLDAETWQDSCEA